jgi:N6-L-threonylcarbamoyladenine synthase
MRILSIETSCDETAVSVVEAEGEFPQAVYTVLGNGLLSQSDLHAPYGGVFPTLAKREHAKNLVPMMQQALNEAELLTTGHTERTQAINETQCEILAREPELYSQLQTWLNEYELPEIDCIAVTNGPGLAPALWVGVNFAKALAVLNDTPVVPVNHMEGHILASLYDAVEDDQLAAIEFPALAVLLSGGHTELVHMSSWGSYEIVGQTRDDAVGEAFDKVARLLGLGYPGGPEIEKRAALARKDNLPEYIELPRPMLHSNDLDLSFSGLKTAVRYAVAEKTLTENEVNALARDFSDAVLDVVEHKTVAAIEQYGSQTVVVGGGVSASQQLRDRLTNHLHKVLPEVTVFFPPRELSTDNSIMIALAGHAHAEQGRQAASTGRIQAEGNRSLSNN